MTDVVYQIIDQKVINYAEIVVALFENCNMRCGFCFQDHESKEGITEKEVMSKVSLILDWVNKNAKSKYFKLHLMGGEIFQDFLVDDNYLQIYQNFIDEIKNNIEDKSKVFIVNPVTNLVFERTDEVLDFLTKNNIKISISYDPKGRFNKNEFSIFKRNIELFKEKISMVSITMTRQNIKAFLDGDEYFDYLYNLFPCHFDPFLYKESSNDQRSLIPYESEILAFNKLLIDKYPETLNITPFTDQKDNDGKMGCTRGNNLTVFPNNFIPSGCSGEIFLKDKSEAKPIIIEKFIKKYDCLNCEYYQKCPFTCFVKDRLTDKMHRDIDGCVFKATFDYAKQKNT